MRTCGLMLSFITFGWNAVFKCHYLGVELLIIDLAKPKSGALSQVKQEF